MSVGGRVIDIQIKDNSVYVNTMETAWSNMQNTYWDTGVECAIHVERNKESQRIEVGDIVWWQGRQAYWTTKDRKTFIEYPILRLGYSHEPKRRPIREVKK